TLMVVLYLCVFFFQAEDGIRDKLVTGVQTCALPISPMSERSGGIIGAALLAALASAATWAAAPAALTRYVLDPAKSSLEFTFVQAGAQNKGKFTRFAVTLDFAPDNLEASRLEVTVEVSSLDTGDKERDDTLRGPDLFDLAKFPQARFSA